MRKLLSGLCAVLLGVAGCSGGGGTSSQTGSPTAQPSVASSIDFPLYDGSRVLASKDYTQVINSTGNAPSGILMAGNGKYHGNEVIAASSASFDQLRTWVRSLSAKSPAGYTSLPHTDVGNARASMQRYGMDFALFQKGQNGKTPEGLIVLVMDPKTVTKSLGPALNLIARYRTAPDFLKKPIDDQVRSQMGFSVSDALQPGGPIGTALDALSDFSHSDQRAIVLVNAQKQ
ncbi:MAG: hypothetical protein M3126_01035 [Candidatus Eremiobacteraeota bacterium]|nr:hypothetical protein [Candidatus Eremiobacteraeota bacterium]